MRDQGSRWWLFNFKLWSVVQPDGSSLVGNVGFCTEDALGGILILSPGWKFFESSQVLKSPAVPGGKPIGCRYFPSPHADSSCASDSLPQNVSYQGASAAMAKKRKASGRSQQPSGPKELDKADARLGPITTYEDVADSEDEFFMNRDQLMLEDEPGSKRRRKEDDDMELSDEEILGGEDDSEEEQYSALPKPSKKSKKSKKGSRPDQSEDEVEEDDEEGDEGWWGASRKEYYNADNIETEVDALEEEAEAKRLQQKKLSKMADEDFMFDGDEWLAAGSEDGEEDDEPVTEVLKDVEITEDMGPQERAQMLRSRYPEFEHLVGELQEQRATLESLRVEAKAGGAKSLEAIKYWVLGCYVASLASYFAILTSPARDEERLEKSLDPSELRDHEIMETLVSCREAWRKIENLKSSKSISEPMDIIPEVLKAGELPDRAQVKAEKKRQKKKAAQEEKAAAEKRAKKLAKAKAVEDTVADLYDLPLPTKKSKKQKTEAATRDAPDSDFGEEDALDERAAADKAARKKTLKFYTSQIAQKANRRSDAAQDVGGDTDIPHRERLRDRQSRLMKEAERRGQKDSKHGADLDDNSDDEGDQATAHAIRNDEDDYYDMVAHNSKKKNADKAAKYAAYAAANKADRVVEKEEVGEDGKRKITYAIEKNKGLAPKRKKDVRNPRVKRKKQYEAKQKKLGSMKPVWKGGEPKGGYQGEVTGINTGVMKSVRL